MRNPVTTLALGGWALFWAGAAVASGPQELSCGTTYCTYKEEIGALMDKHYHGHCYGSGNTEVTGANSSMKCNTNNVENMNCTNPEWNYYKQDLYWACACDNLNVNEQHVGFSISCPPPS